MARSATPPKRDQPLNLYEREAAWRVGSRRAKRLRMELESHLAIDIANGREDGLSESDAYDQALLRLGDLRRAARAERPRFLGLGRILLFAVPWLLLTAWTVQPGLIRNIGIPVAVPMALVAVAGLFLLLGTLLVRRLGLLAIGLGVVSSMGLIAIFIGRLSFLGRNGYPFDRLAGDIFSGFLSVAIPYLVILAILEGFEFGYASWSRRGTRA